MQLLKPTRIFALLPFMTIAAWGQSQIAQPLGEEVPPLTTSSEQISKNVLELRLRMGSSFDDNALANSSGRHSDTEYDVQPTFDFRQELERLKWNFFYSPGFGVNQHYSAQRYFSQVGGTQLTYELRQHLELTAHGQADATTNPFEQLDRNASIPQPNVIDQSNPTVVLPKNKEEGERGGLGLDWFTSPLTSVSLTGDFSNLRYLNLPDQTLGQRKLINTRTVNGHAGVQHRLTEKETVGILYDYQDLAFPLGHARTVSHSFEAFNEYAITPTMKIAVFGGPEYSRQHDELELNIFFFTFNIPTFKKMWSPTAGAQYTWTGQRNAFRATYIRKITDGGGLIGAVTFNDGNVNFRRQLTSRWTATLNGYYATSDALGLVNTSKLSSYAATAGLGRAINPSLTIDLNYSRLHQTMSGSIAGFGRQDHNRVSLSLQYRWDHPVGR